MVLKIRDSELVDVLSDPQLISLGFVLNERGKWRRQQAPLRRSRSNTPVASSSHSNSPAVSSRHSRSPVATPRRSRTPVSSPVNLPSRQPTPQNSLNLLRNPWTPRSDPLSPRPAGVRKPPRRQPTPLALRHLRNSPGRDTANLTASGASRGRGNSPLSGESLRHVPVANTTVPSSTPAPTSINSPVSGVGFPWAPLANTAVPNGLGQVPQTPHLQTPQVPRSSLGSISPQVARDANWAPLGARGQETLWAPAHSQTPHSDLAPLHHGGPGVNAPVSGSFGPFPQSAPTPPQSAPRGLGVSAPVPDGFSPVFPYAPTPPRSDLGPSVSQPVSQGIDQRPPNADTSGSVPYVHPIPSQRAGFLRSGLGPIAEQSVSQGFGDGSPTPNIPSPRGWNQAPSRLGPGTTSTLAFRGQGSGDDSPTPGIPSPRGWNQAPTRLGPGTTTTPVSRGPSRVSTPSGWNQPPSRLGPGTPAPSTPAPHSPGTVSSAGSFGPSSAYVGPFVQPPAVTRYNALPSAPRAVTPASPPQWGRSGETPRPSSPIFTFQAPPGMNEHSQAQQGESPWLTDANVGPFQVEDGGQRPFLSTASQSFSGTPTLMTDSQYQEDSPDYEDSEAQSQSVAASEASRASTVRSLADEDQMALHLALPHVFPRPATAPQASSGAPPQSTSSPPRPHLAHLPVELRLMLVENLLPRDQIALWRALPNAFGFIFSEDVRYQRLYRLETLEANAARSRVVASAQAGASQQELAADRARARQLATNRRPKRHSLLWYAVTNAVPMAEIRQLIDLYRASDIELGRDAQIGENPLLWVAIDSGRQDVVDYLIQVGVGVDPVDLVDHILFQALQIRRLNPRGSVALEGTLHLLANRGVVDLRAAAVDLRGNRRTWLTTAVRLNWTQTVDRAIRGLNNTQLLNGLVQVALRYRRRGMIQLLARYGADTSGVDLADGDSDSGV